MQSSIVVELSGVALTLVPVVVALTSIIKAFILDSRFYPVISIGLGMALSILVLPSSIAVSVVSGLIIGLTASGAYSGVKSMVS